VNGDSSNQKRRWGRELLFMSARSRFLEIVIFAKHLARQGLKSRDSGIDYIFGPLTRLVRSDNTV